MRFLPHLVGVSLLKLLLFLLCCTGSSSSEHVQELAVSEGVPIGHRIGFVSSDPATAQQYFIVPAPGSKSSVDADLVIDHQTGEIRTKRLLDRETQASYAFVAIPQTGGDNIRVVIKVLDENDNPPAFPVPVMHIEFPENTPRDVKRTLNPARDLDTDKFNTQKYNIISGNVNNAFKLAYHRERDSVLYLDLQINGLLDREITSSYTLVIEALDGGTPPLRGQMIVNITIQDVNDNQPIFNQSRYFATVLENATVHTSVLQVYATDIDEGSNGLVEYYINRRQSDKDQMFRIDAKTGLVLVNKPLDFETKELHELVIVAKDNGDQPLETTAFVTIKVIDINDNQPIIDVIFLSDDATPKISENALPGEFVARISVNDPDSRTKYSNVNVSLSGGEGHFGLTTRDNIIYLMIVSLPLDRELKANYTLDVVATDKGAPPLHASKTIYLRITDVNDNAPIFEQETYYANIMEVADPGTSVLQVTAVDEDEGNNSMVLYSLQDTPDTHSQWFQIDQHSGLITTQTHIDCETEPVPKLTVVARDNGMPPLSSTATVLITIHDVNDNEPIFDQSFYNVSVAESESKGTCILTVSATDSDCGVNAMVNYTIGDRYKKLSQFTIKADTGEICIANELDYESRNSYEFPVVATDRGGLSTTAVVKILLTDVNDNRPVFYPREYNVSLREADIFRQANPIVQVAATDSDFSRFGKVTYKIIRGNEADIFRLDPTSGELFVAKPKLISRTNGAFYHLNVSAVDGGDLHSVENAEIYVSIIDSAQKPPIFEKARYSYQVKENAKHDTMVGSITAVSSSRNDVRYSIYSGDPDRYFSIDPLSGSIRVANVLDHESKSQVLLNIQAMSGDPPAYGHTQVNIDIEDVNDNPPEFEASAIQISIPENADLGVPIYAAHAKDRDSGKSGVVSYYLVNLENATTKSGLFSIDPKSGALTLLRHLDYESRQKHALIVTAVDLGDPPLSANLSVQIDVQDVNDNVPVFKKLVYAVNVSEETPINTKILQVEAIDYDTGNNARITYKIDKVRSKSDSDTSETLFGIFPNNGWLYLKGSLDREVCDFFNITVLASDNGTPIYSSKSHVILNVLDENDNSPAFLHKSYEFAIAENLPKGVHVGLVKAVDADLGPNSIISYTLVPGNASFSINSLTGEILTRESLDRESQTTHDIVVEARDQGRPSRTARVGVRIVVQDVNDNAPDIVDPQDDVIIVREGQPVGTEVVKIRAVDRDAGANASVRYSVIRGRDSDGFDTFEIDPSSGLIRTRKVLDHEEKNLYRLTIAATDSGTPSKQSVRALRIEVLGLHDNRPTFTSSSVVFRVREDVSVGHVVGSIMTANTDSAELDIQYTLTPITNDSIPDAFEVDYQSGSLVVARQLDRERQAEFKLEIRCLDITATHPQSSAIMVKIEVADVNDNAPRFPRNPIVVKVQESAKVGSVVHTFKALDLDSGRNGEVQYVLESDTFVVDSLTGVMTLSSPLDYETTTRYILKIFATDQSSNVTERHTDSATVEVLVVDENDNDPRIVYPSPARNKTIYLSDHLGAGQVVSPILAVDPDSGDFGKISYSIVSGNEEGYFELDSQKGNLKLAKPLRTIKREVYDGSRIAKYTNLETSKFTLLVNVEDLGGRAVQSEVRIVVIGAQNIPPRFSDLVYFANISESVTVGSFVVRVNAKSYSYSDDNITYSIPRGVANDLFAVDPIRGIVTTKGALDRETHPTYVVPIYAHDHQSNNFGIASVVVRAIDVNDNKPVFGPEACSTLLIPENQDTGIIHIVVATDRDADQNGEITYSISGGNIGNRFSIDSYTGELSAKSLDREQQSKYVLQVTAQDRGSPVSFQTTCNITVMIEDENDNSPRFEKSRYSVAVSEGVGLGHSVLSVKAFDPDGGSNGRVHYSLQNEDDSMFNIDSATGVISTAGFLDREKRETYSLTIIATDGGKSNARSEKTEVLITIEDANDNAPQFKSYPYTTRVSHLVQPGQLLLKLFASDPDFGINGEVTYELIPSKYSHKFRLDLNTGDLTSTQSLASENDKTIFLEVVCRDKGQIPQSASNYIEIKVGESTKRHSHLRFTETSYSMFDRRPLSLHTSESAALIIAHGNDDEVFTISGNTLRVREKVPEARLRNHYSLGVMAKNDNGFAFAEVKVIMQANASPKFTQPQYSTAIPEGKSKGSFVAKVKAMDEDESRFLYHIVDGNHDNAFIIEPASSGIVKTNIVLDREIRDHYKLRIIATNVGVPQMTGTSTVLVRVLDTNDNQPTFPQNNQVSVAEDTSVGTSVAQITANDVDTTPSLTYSFSDLKPEFASMFAINRFNGKIMLKKPLDFEKMQSYKLQILVSDREHTAETTLTLNVLDSNDNAPIFDKTVYQATVSNSSPLSLSEVITLNATDSDTGKNAEISYTISDAPGFSMLENTVFVNSSLITSPDVDIIVTAQDHGVPALKSVVPLKVQVMSSGQQHNVFQSQYRRSLPEDTPVGSKVLSLISNQQLNGRQIEASVEGEGLGVFGVVYPELDIILLRPLDRETKDQYKLELTVSEKSPVVQNFPVTVVISVEDVNDNPPIFETGPILRNVSESVALKSVVGSVRATDRDLGVNSEVIYRIVSGNDDETFTIDLISGTVSVQNKLDFDLGKQSYDLVVEACDSGAPSRCSVQTFGVTLEDFNDHHPKFSLHEYFAVIGENEPVGEFVFQVHATDLDAGQFGVLEYSLHPYNDYDVDESWKNFRIDFNGRVYAAASFDYEVRNHYNLVVMAKDVGGKSAKATLHVLIESRDEFPPVFVEKEYTFNLKPVGGHPLPVGHVVGFMKATDEDLGVDGRVTYQLTTNNQYFRINYTTGAVTTKRKIDTVLSSKDISLVVVASSGRQDSLSSMAMVEILIDHALAAEKDIEEPSWVIGLLITVLLFLTVFITAFFFIHWRKRGLKHVSKPRLNSENNTVNTNSYVDPSTFDTIPIRGSDATQSSSSGFAPPRYDEIPPYGLHTGSSGAATTSDLSTSDQSGSSGRGSAEDDGEDEEIRMINEGPLQREALNGRLSDVSVHNGNRKYLSRMAEMKSTRSNTSKRGLSDHHHHPMQIETLQMYDEENEEADLTNLIYAKLNEAPASVRDEIASTGSIKQAVEHMIMTGFQQVPMMVQGPSSLRGCDSHSTVMHGGGEEDLTSNYNWDYLLDWGPQYQPLAHVFSEIARLKDDSMSVSGQSAASSIRSRNSLHHTIKHIPPPLITNVAPRLIQATAPVLSSRSSNASGRYSNAGANTQAYLLRSNLHYEQPHGFSTPSPMPPSFAHNLLPNVHSNQSPSPNLDMHLIKK